MFFKVTLGILIVKRGSIVKKVALVPVQQPINYFLVNNISLGLRAEAEDLGLCAELRRLVAPPKGRPVDFKVSKFQILIYVIPN